MTNSLLLVLPLLSARQLVSFARSRQSAMESSEPLSAAHKTPARACFKSRSRASVHRNQLYLRKNQSVFLESPSPSVPLFVSIDCHSSKMYTSEQPNLVSVHDLSFRRPETHLVIVVSVVLRPGPTSDPSSSNPTASTSNSDSGPLIPNPGYINDMQYFSEQDRLQHLFSLSPDSVPLPTTISSQSAD